MKDMRFFFSLLVSALLIIGISVDFKSVFFLIPKTEIMTRLHDINNGNVKLGFIYC